MTARQLRLLAVPRLQLVADAVEQLDVALLGILLERRDERPGHGAGRLGRNSCVGPKENKTLAHPYGGRKGFDRETHEV